MQFLAPTKIQTICETNTIYRLKPFPLPISGFAGGFICGLKEVFVRDILFFNNLRFGILHGKIPLVFNKA